MILGRPTNLWLGFVAAAVGFVSVAAINLGADPVLVTNVGGSATGLLGALIVLIANQPPTVTQGDQVKVVTPTGEPNKTITA